MEAAAYNTLAVQYGYEPRQDGDMETWSYGTDVWAAGVSILHVATSSWPVGCTDQAAWLDSALDAKHPWSRQDNMLAESSARAGTREWVAQYVRESGGELDDGLIQA
eukprot:1345443-Rhodomonas_salina.1